MCLRQWARTGWLLGLVFGWLSGPAHAGMVGFPAARLQTFHLSAELAGDSFQEDLENTGDATATTGRALLTVGFGLTNWSEIFARVGVAEFNIDEALFSGKFGFAYGGGIRLRLLTVPVGMFGIVGQYLRFTSNDDDSAGARVEGEWDEFDVVVGFGTKRFGAFAFYIGGAFHHSEVSLETQGTGPRTTLESKIPFRLLLGAQIFPLIDVPGGNFLVNIEARVIGEIPQFTLGVQYAF